MDQQSKCKTQTYKTPRRQHRRKSKCSCGDGEFSDAKSKAQFMKENLLNSISLQLKTSALWKTLWREWKYKTAWEKILALHEDDKGDLIKEDILV